MYDSDWMKSRYQQWFKELVKKHERMFETLESARNNTEYFPSISDLGISEDHGVSDDF